MLGHRKVPHDIHHFHKTRVSDPNSTLLEYLLYAAGVNPLVSGKKNMFMCMHEHVQNYSGMKCVFQ